MTRVCSFLTLAFAISLSPLSAAAQLEVTAIWNFDGRFSAADFNRVVVIVHNAGTTDYAGPLSLTAGLSERHDRSVHISAGATQQIPFHFWSSHELPHWDVEWGEEKSASVDPRRGKPMHTVRLSEELSRQPPAGIYPSPLFPADIAYIPSSVRSLTLDHVPNWTAAQLRAFIDWIHCGGTVVVVPNQWTGVPRFTGTLAFLNDTKPQTVGAGRVVDQVEEDPTTSRDQSRVSTYRPQRNLTFAELSPQRWFSSFQDRFRPNPNRPGIFLVCLVYAVVVVFGGFVVAKKSRGLLPPVALLVGSIVAATLLLWFLGRVSYDTGSMIREFIYERPISNERMAVQRIATLFSANGGRYSLATPHQAEVFGQYNNDFMATSAHDNHGSFALPLFSTANYVHRHTRAGRSVIQSVSGLPDAGTLKELHSRAMFTQTNQLPDLRVELTDHASILYGWLQLGSAIVFMTFDKGVGTPRNVYTYDEDHPVDLFFDTYNEVRFRHSMPGRGSPSPQTARPVSLELFLAFSEEGETEVNGAPIPTATTRLQHYTLLQE